MAPAPAGQHGLVGAKHAPDGRQRRRRHMLVRHVAFLGLAALGLYVVWPTLWDVFATLPELRTIEPWWFVGMAAAIAASATCVWWLYRTVLHVHSWYLVATSQLASAAFGRIVPGGSAGGMAMQYQMLTMAGVPGGRVASSIAAVSYISGTAILALPLFALPALVGVIPIESTLRRVGLFGLGLAAAVILFAALVLTIDHPLHWLGRGLDRVKGAVLRRPSRHPDIADKLLAERDIVRRVLGGNWRAALLAALGQRAFDFAALVMAVYATGARPNPLLVLLAYAVAQILTVVPITPGGLGFVEVGLVGFLRFAGLDPVASLLATLAYRLVAYWVPLPLGGVAYGLYVHHYHRKVSPGAVFRVRPGEERAGGAAAGGRSSPADENQGAGGPRGGRTAA